ncbi:MAG TPA: hypothetical protein VKS22_06315 [Candidatus Binataceae bacterium]|nr:hypothetical protein [Candidatus Binataceae bacterium]
MLTASDAETIARKLKAEFRPKNRKHKVATISANGKKIGRFGIRRGSGELSHDYIARQIFIKYSDAEGIAQCRLYFDDYERLLRENGHYPD